MIRYIALLRGINISGRNKISMTELKPCFIELGYSDVLTHVNSGNVIFSASDKDAISLAESIKDAIQKHFNLDVPVLVVSQEMLANLLNNAPKWWGTDDKEIYDNLIFVIPNATAENIATKVGEPTKKIDKVSVYNNVIFWSFDREKYAKSNWWKRTAAAGIAELITIRTANTIKKLIEM